MNGKPRISVESTSTRRFLELASIAGLAFAAFLLAANWGKLPRTIPSHFGLDGLPDAYSDKSSLFLLPGVALLVYLLLSIVGKYPHTFSYAWKITAENAYRQYQLAGTMLAALKAEIVWIFDYIVLTEIKFALGRSRGLSPLFLPIMLIVIFGPICLYLYVSYKER